jgi:hypothetical protein
MRTRILTTSAAFLMMGATAALAASATAVSVATNGGSSSSTATAYGNADATAYSGATNWGRSVANSTAYGNPYGYAAAMRWPMSDRGLAISNSRADARGLYGGNALATSESLAGAVHGVAISNSEADALGIYGGNAQSHSYSTALGRYGQPTATVGPSATEAGAAERSAPATLWRTPTEAWPEATWSPTAGPGGGPLQGRTESGSAEADRPESVVPTCGPSAGPTCTDTATPGRGHRGAIV